MVFSLDKIIKRYTFRFFEKPHIITEMKRTISRVVVSTDPDYKVGSPIRVEEKFCELLNKGISIISCSPQGVARGVVFASINAQGATGFLDPVVYHAEGMDIYGRLSENQYMEGVTKKGIYFVFQPVKPQKEDLLPQ